MLTTTGTATDMLIRFTLFMQAKEKPTEVQPLQYGLTSQTLNCLLNTDMELELFKPME